MPFVRAGGVIWAPVCKELHWEQVIPHKPAKQLSDGQYVNLLLTGAVVDVDLHMKDWLSYRWLSEPSSAFWTIFITNRKKKCLNVLVLKIQVSIMMLLFERKDTLDFSKLDPSQGCTCVAKIDTKLIWSSQRMFAWQPSLCSLPNGEPFKSSVALSVTAGLCIASTKLKTEFHVFLG